MACFSARAGGSAIRHSGAASGAVVDETTRLLVRRTRAGLWILLLALVLFAAVAAIFHRETLVPLALLKGVQLATILGVFWVLRSPARWHWCVPAALVTVTEVCVTTAASGVFTGDVETTYLLFIVFTTATAAFLPWGARPQLAMVGVASLAAAWNARALGEPAAAFSHPAVAMVLAFVTSVYIAWDSRRYHLERKRAEEALAASSHEAESEAEVSAALARVGREMIALLDRPVILDRLCRITTEVLGCDHSHTWLWDADADAYVPVAGHGGLPGHGGGIGEVKVSRARIAGLLDQLARDDLAQIGGAGGLPAPYGVPTTLHVALRRGTDVIGIHTAGHHDLTAPFTAQQQRIMRGIGQTASLALANARLVEELERASRLKSEFLSTMSHELRTPLNVILGYTDIVEESLPATGGTRDLVGRIRTASRDLLELIDSTLEIGRTEAGRDEPRLEPVPLATFWSRLGEGCARLPRKPGVAFEWTDGVPDVPVMTDPRKLSVVVRNLMTNALKFTERGGVTAGLRLEEDAFVVRVADTGIGIRPEDQDLIFEMFRQADGSDSRRFGGSGLGLYIVRRFVDQLGGAVRLESAPGRGSTFTITLPRSSVARRAA